MRPKRSQKAKTPPPASPLDARRRALEEEQAKLQAEIARRQKLIEDAPRIAQEQQQRRREELIRRASRTEARFGTRTALQDPRFAYEADVGAPPKMRRLKSERRQGMLTFFALCIVLVLVLGWLYFTLFR